MPKNWEEARDWLANAGDALLVVWCPRCERRGVVSPDGQGQFRIEWRDETNDWTWRDADVTLAELTSPEFGCGYDRRSERGFVGGAPYLPRAR